MDNTLGRGISNSRKYAVLWYMDQSIWLCWIRWRKHRAKATHRIQFQPDRNEKDAATFPAVWAPWISMLWESALTPPWQNISETQTSKQENTIQLSPKYQGHGKRAAQSIWRRSNPAVATTARTSPSSECSKRTKRRTDQSQLMNKRREITLVNTSYNARILNGISII